MTITQVSCLLHLMKLSNHILHKITVAGGEQIDMQALRLLEKSNNLTQELEAEIQKIEHGMMTGIKGKNV